MALGAPPSRFADGAAFEFSGVSFRFGGDTLVASELIALDSLLLRDLFDGLTCLGPLVILPVSSCGMSVASLWRDFERVRAPLALPVPLAESECPVLSLFNGVDDICGTPGCAETPETISPVPPTPGETREVKGE